MKSIFTFLTLLLGIFCGINSHAQYIGFLPIEIKSIGLDIDSDEDLTIIVENSDDGVSVGTKSQSGLIPWISDSKMLFFDNNSIGIINPTIKTCKDSVAYIIISDGKITIKYENGSQDSYKILHWSDEDSATSSFRSTLIKKYGYRTQEEASKMHRENTAATL